MVREHCDRRVDVPTGSAVVLAFVPKFPAAVFRQVDRMHELVFAADVQRVVPDESGGVELHGAAEIGPAFHAAGGIDF